MISNSLMYLAHKIEVTLRVIRGKYVNTKTNKLNKVEGAKDGNNTGTVVKAIMCKLLKDSINAAVTIALISLP